MVRQQKRSFVSTNQIGQNLQLKLIFCSTSSKIMNSTGNLSFDFDNYNNTFDTDSNEDFFKGLFENRPAKISALIFNVFGACVLLPLMFGIIWYENFGSDNKRTLLNKLVASLCWSCFELKHILYLFNFKNNLFCFLASVFFFRSI